MRERVRHLARRVDAHVSQHCSSVEDDRRLLDQMAGRIEDQILLPAGRSGDDE